MIGFLNVCKPKGMTSSRVVSKIKRLTHCKVGHLGTLDPLASGVLPIAVGKATRLFQYFLNKDKVYIAKAKFGYETDTLDLAGSVIKTSQIIPSKAEIESAVSELVKVQMQLPPLFSAKKVNGIRAYELARQGKMFNLNPKQIEIYDMKLLSYDNNEAEFYIHCTAGTYVRSIVRDIALSLNTCATTTSILRIKSGVFDIEHSVDLNQLNEDNISNFIEPVEKALKGLKVITVSKKDEEDLKSGKMVFLKNAVDGELLVKTSGGKVLGICQAFNHYLKIKTYLLED